VLALTKPTRLRTPSESLGHARTDHRHTHNFSHRGHKQAPTGDAQMGLAKLPTSHLRTAASTVWPGHVTPPLSTLSRCRGSSCSGARAVADDASIERLQQGESRTSRRPARSADGARGLRVRSGASGSALVTHSPAVHEAHGRHLEHRGCRRARHPMRWRAGRYRPATTSSTRGRRAASP
jgi:hypothetical protein